MADKCPFKIGWPCWTVEGGEVVKDFVKEIHHYQGEWFLRLNFGKLKTLRTVFSTEEEAERVLKGKK